MKSLLSYFFICAGICYGEFNLPSEISSGIAQSTGFESGGFSIRGTDEAHYKDYIKQHWREIADNIECLPLADPGPGRSFVTEQHARNASAANFAASCEVLEPLEYLEFLDKWLELYEQERIQFHALERHWGGEWDKLSFLEVNWEHPRVQRYLQKLLLLIPPDEEVFKELVEDISKGKLADNYLTQRDDSFRPQTLPGIKLQRPWNSLIKKFERITGNRVPPDPEFPEEPPRASRRPSASSSDEESSERPQGGSAPVRIGVILAVLLLLCGVIRYARKSK